MALRRFLPSVAWVLLGSWCLLVAPGAAPAQSWSAGDGALLAAEEEGEAPSGEASETKAEKKARKKAEKEERERQKRLEKARKEEAKQAEKAEKKAEKRAAEGEKAGKKKKKKKKSKGVYTTTLEKPKYASRGVDELLREAEGLLAAGKWYKAQEILMVLEDNERARDVQAEVKLALADSYYGQGGTLNWVEALSRYRSFLTFYPNHPKADYAQYHIAMCHLRQVPKPDRDQSPTENALFEFQKLVELYPRGEWTGRAEEQIRECRELLAEHEFIVARFYFVRKFWTAAAGRLQHILDEYPDYSKKAEVYHQLAQASYNMGATEEGDIYRQLYEDAGGQKAVEGAKRKKGKPGKAAKKAAKAEKKEAERLAKEEKKAAKERAKAEKKKGSEDGLPEEE
jgi:outer membrane protein assembly factor BamD